MTSSSAKELYEHFDVRFRVDGVYHSVKAESLYDPSRARNVCISAGLRYKGKQEDTWCHVEFRLCHMFMICDGHGGSGASELLRDQFPGFLNKRIETWFERQPSSSKRVGMRSEEAVATLRSVLADAAVTFDEQVLRPSHESCTRCENRPKKTNPDGKRERTKSKKIALGEEKLDHAFSALNLGDEDLEEEIDIEEDFRKYGWKKCPRDGSDPGSTCILLIHMLDCDDYFMLNLGDSRGILVPVVKPKKKLLVSSAHSPGVASERKRIEAAGGKVTSYSNDEKRVCGTLAMSRAFGDFYLKPKGSRESYVIAVPEVQHWSNSPEERKGFKGKGLCAVLASDGMDTLTWTKVTAQIKKAFKSSDSASATPPMMRLGMALMHGAAGGTAKMETDDNLTVLTIHFA